ncbi:hypothetical protein PHYPSEUDO_013283 [Phytophthora pseudosyringae]|uniref:KilA-N domain-containing protein n=1 Tax=Phytophthora pseudosyringae TaxID=221518 RepID=A0A8T1V651_9STRA|nr:hypothetical protein PHYPSEUDO_013283 [Phytophthora pseudosyringae]
MSAPAYSTITNGVDHRLTIIMHNDSGYYNITKTASLLQTLKQEEEGVVGNSPQPNKRGKHTKEDEEAYANSHRPNTRAKLTANWFRNSSTREKIQECANLNDLSVEECSFIINDGDNAHSGTYIHPDLYDYFVMWLSPKYSMRVSAILKQHHYAANMKVLKEKDDKIDLLRSEMREQAEVARREMKQRDEEAQRKHDAQSAQIAALLGYAKAGDAKLDNVQDELIETKETVTTALSYLEEKSVVSTSNPRDESKHHYFVIMYHDVDGIRVANLIAGQRRYVDSKIRTKALEGYEVALTPFYNANGIDLRQNAMTAFIERRQEIIDAENSKRKASRGTIVSLHACS